MNAPQGIKAIDDIGGCENSDSTGRQALDGMPRQFLFIFQHVTANVTFRLIGDTWDEVRERAIEILRAYRGDDYNWPESFALTDVYEIGERQIVDPEGY